MWDEIIESVRCKVRSARLEIDDKITGILDDDYDHETEQVIAIGMLLESVEALCRSMP